MQYILDLKQSRLTLAVVAALHGAIAELSLQKFSSNVIEKCLTSGDPEVYAEIYAEISPEVHAGAPAELIVACDLNKDGASSHHRRNHQVVSAVTRELLAARNLGTLLHDPFANYVMQTLVTVASEEDIENFVAKVQPHSYGGDSFMDASRSSGRICLPYIIYSLILAHSYSGAAAHRIAA